MELVSEWRFQISVHSYPTQEHPADKVGTKKSYISLLENGKCDIQLSTLYRVFEDSHGKNRLIDWLRS